MEAKESSRGGMGVAIPPGAGVRSVGPSATLLLATLLAGCAFHTGGPPRSVAAPEQLQARGSPSPDVTRECVSQRLQALEYRLVSDDPTNGYILAEKEEKEPGTLVRGGRIPDRTLYSYLSVRVAPVSGSEEGAVVRVTAVTSEDRLEGKEGVEAVERSLRVRETVVQEARSTLSICTDSPDVSP